jgi:NAD(P)-dependent dehydrogenase (short-subunit alcohol dehydrogenase family)
VTIEKSLQKLSAEFRKETFSAFICDVTSEQDLCSLWEGTIKAFGRVDIWINNAGIAYDQVLFHKIPTEVFLKIIDTNVKGLMLATHIVYNKMLQQGYGAIYNMEGLGSDGRSIPGLTPYGTTKRAVRYFTDAFASEVKDGHIIVGTIMPGMVLTDLILDPLRKEDVKKKNVIRIYNILASEVEEVTPFLVRKMIGNRKNGAKISFLNPWKVMWRFISAPLTKRDVVSKYL